MSINGDVMSDVDLCSNNDDSLTTDPAGAEVCVYSRRLYTPTGRVAGLFVEKHRRRLCSVKTEVHSFNTHFPSWA